MRFLFQYFLLLFSSCAVRALISIAICGKQFSALFPLSPATSISALFFIYLSWIFICPPLVTLSPSSYYSYLWVIIFPLCHTLFLSIISWLFCSRFWLQGLFVLRWLLLTPPFFLSLNLLANFNLSLCGKSGWVEGWYPRASFLITGKVGRKLLFNSSLRKSLGNLAIKLILYYPERFLADVSFIFSILQIKYYNYIFLEMALF